MPYIKTEIKMVGLRTITLKTIGYRSEYHMISPISEEFYLKGNHNIKQELLRTDLNGVDFMEYLKSTFNELGK